MYLADESLTNVNTTSCIPTFETHKEEPRSEVQQNLDDSTSLKVNILQEIERSEPTSLEP